MLKKTIIRILIVFISLFIIFNFNSCKKYEDGPILSLKSKDARLTGIWKAIEMIDTDEDKDELNGENMFFDFKDDGVFSLRSEYEDDANGTWKWGTNKKTIIINVYSTDIEFTIFRLSNNDFWFNVEHYAYKCEKQ